MSTISVTLPTDGSTADAADVNTPITTIVNAINGGLDNTNIAASAGIAGSKLADAGITYAKLLSTIFSGQVQTYAVTGTNMPTTTGYYVNLGGIKLCWGVAGSAIGVSGAGFQSTGFTVILPSSFFTTVQLPLYSVANLAATQFVSVVGQGFSTTSLTAQVVQSSGSSAQITPAWFVIGT